VCRSLSPGGSGGVKLIVESPVRTIETNVRGTEVVLALANKKQKRVLVASTSEVYGLSADVPFKEDGNLVMGATTKGRWSDACSKAIDEFWHSLTGEKRNCRPPSSDFSILWERDKPVATAWLYPLL